MVWECSTEGLERLLCKRLPTPLLRTVIAVLAMVDCICHRLRKGKDSPEWAAIGEKVLAHLKMDQAEFEHLAWDQQDRFAA